MYLLWLLERFGLFCGISSVLVNGCIKEFILMIRVSLCRRRMRWVCMSQSHSFLAELKHEFYSQTYSKWTFEG